MEVGFLEERLIFSTDRKGSLFVTESVLTYYTEIVKPQLISVPTDFVTDFGSIPRFIQPLIPKDGLALWAYILHDYLYRTGLFTRSECDYILEEAMKSLGVNWLQRKAVLNGLKIGGWVAWNKHRKGLKCTK